MDEFGVTTGTLVYQDQSGLGRAVCNDQGAYRTILSSVILGAMRTGDRAQLIANCVDYLVTGTGVAEKAPKITGPARMAVNPNPVARGGAVRFTLASETRGELSVMDVFGRLITRQAVSGRDVELHLDVPVGTYFARFSGPSVSATASFAVIR